MYVIIWEYQVKPDKQAEFEKIYSPKGTWAELFKKGTGIWAQNYCIRQINP